MRLIEKRMIDAIASGKNWASGNTRVNHDPVIDGCEVEVYLHGNLIAKRFLHGQWRVTLAGWNTRVTRSRLNALADTFGSWAGNIYTRKGQAYVGDRKVTDTEWVDV
jgi:hypothetical protein